MSDAGYRPLGFESDVANANFAGPQRPDDLLHVEIYMHKPLDKNKTEAKAEETGVYRPIYGEEIPYIRIMKPGDQLSIIETPLREDHKRRWPAKWQYFQIQMGMIDGGQNAPGWKLDEWEDISKDDVHRLKFLRFFTVEQLAGANDAQVQGIGMGGEGLRQRAKEAIKAKYSASVKAELDAKDKELNEMKERLAKLEAALSTPQTAPEKPKKTLSPEHLEKLRLGRAKKAAEKAAKGA